MLIVEIDKNDNIHSNDWNVISELAESWYGTPDHCMLYSSNPSRFVAVWHKSSDNREIVSACFFSYAKYPIFGKQVLINGEASINMSQIIRLLLTTKLKILTVQIPEESIVSYKMPWWRGRLQLSDSDWIVPLPKTLEDYFANLGRTTRKHLKTYLQKFNKQLTTDKIILRETQIQYSHISSLINLHKYCRDDVGKEFTITEDQVQRRFVMSQKTGMFCSRWVDGKLIGGTLSFIHKSKVYLSLVAHDPAYNEYHTGLICLLDTIQYLIENKYTHYNFHFRYSPFKTRLGGQEHHYYKLVVFSNVITAICWNLRNVFKNIQNKLKIG